MTSDFDRRQLLRGAALLGGGLALTGLLPVWAQSANAAVVPTLPTLSGSDIALTIGRTPFMLGKKMGHAMTVNGTLPAPIIRLKEGQNVRLAVTNTLDEDSSIHWHGLLLPFQFDGVPGISFPGIKPHSTFVYEFPVRQSGTYWYHSHSNMQEAMGLYGAIVIDPAGPDPVAYDREYVIVLSDWSFMHPHMLMQKLKQSPGYFNYQKPTLAGLLAGDGMAASERLEWAKMRMDASDILDVSGSTYTYLINGHGPDDNWTALFEPGERVRLRFINASAMSIFNVKIPGLKLTVVQADGQNVRPVDVDALQISVAETFDVIVTPDDDRAYTLVAEAIDSSGMARATLAPRAGMTAAVPPLGVPPQLGMIDMGMDMSGMGMSAMDMSGGGMEMNMSMRDGANAPGVKMGPGVASIAPMPVSRLSEPGQGLAKFAARPLVYTDLVALEANPDTRAPSREMEIHLTANMDRYMWSFDGVKFSEVKAPIPFHLNERVRVTLVNDTMMSHPIHLHGHFFEVDTGNPGFNPRKHTVNVLPGGKVTFDLTADAPGDWAFHCHLLLHMHAGMFQVVTVRPMHEAAA